MLGEESHKNAFPLTNFNRFQNRLAAVGVDPALTSHDNSDETGIIVAGMSGGGKAYVLDDLSIAAKPEIWAQKVVSAYRKYKAKLIVMESNAGGELLVNLLKSHISKSARAEPIVILYQKKMIFHARQFQKLEMQMATYEPGSKSPDRLDAMVWAVSELFNISQSDILAPSVWTIDY